MEHLRQADKEKLLAAELERQRELHEAQPQEDVGAREKLLNCLERCTRKLEPVSRNIISRYYLGKERARIENRRALARGLGITMNALTIRACRIRDKLESCVKECLN